MENFFRLEEEKFYIDKKQKRILLVIQKQRLTYFFELTMEEVSIFCIRANFLTGGFADMIVGKDIPLPWWKKYTLTMEEASLYFGIGEKTLRRFVKEHPNEDFIIYNGTKVQIKRKVFEKFIDEKVTVM